jgi:hypothetical protein
VDCRRAAEACTHIATCQLYSQFKSAAPLAVWRNLFCESDFTRCVRYQAALEGRPVPATLLPNGKDLATMSRRAT